MFSLPGAERSFTSVELASLSSAPDWYPADHPQMPPLVARGHGDISACGYCHLPNGAGRPENAALAGLPADYIIRQVQDFARDARSPSRPGRVPAQMMIRSARLATLDPEVEAAARYFAMVPFRSTCRVVEADLVPTTVVSGWIYNKTFAIEALDSRIIEVADDHARFELRDPRTTYTAYVPFGSIARGEVLTLGCRSCHGGTFRGLSTAPPIAGRSPSYLARQLFDLRSGARHGAAAAAMMPIVETFSNDDVVAICAYVAQLAP